MTLKYKFIIVIKIVSGVAQATCLNNFHPNLKSKEKTDSGTYKFPSILREIQS